MGIFFLLCFLSCICWLALFLSVVAEQIARLFSGTRPATKEAAAGAAVARRKGSSAAAAAAPGGKGGEVVVHALRLVENTDRFSSDMRALEKGKRRELVRVFCCCFSASAGAREEAQKFHVSSGWANCLARFTSARSWVSSPSFW